MLLDADGDGDVDFSDIAKFDPQELLHKSHNIVRHPDMPPAAFQNLWDEGKAGRPWVGVVKNRCKDGDHYWVDAHVTPIFRDGQVVGYESVRVKPARDLVGRAEGHRPGDPVAPSAALNLSLVVDDSRSMSIPILTEAQFNEKWAFVEKKAEAL